MCKEYRVTITETLKMTVTVTADDQQQAEQTVSDDWHSGKYILGAENFVDVELEAVPAVGEL